MAVSTRNVWENKKMNFHLAREKSCGKINGYNVVFISQGWQGDTNKSVIDCFPGKFYVKYKTNRKLRFFRKPDHLWHLLSSLVITSHKLSLSVSLPRSLRIKRFATRFHTKLFISFDGDTIYAWNSLFPWVSGKNVGRCDCERKSQQ